MPITRTAEMIMLSCHRPPQNPNMPQLLQTQVPLHRAQPPTTDDLELQNRNQNYNSSSDDDNDDDEWYEKELGGDKYRCSTRKKRINRRALIEWTLFLIIATCLICSLTLHSLRNELRFGIAIWKWCLMVMVVFCGRLVAGWVVGFAVFLIERNLMLREKVLYFVYGLRKSFQSCAWLALVLLAWTIMFPNVHNHNSLLRKVFRFLIAVVVGGTIWLVKIVLVKVLASSFHVATFFDRMKESVFHHYVLDALSGPPLEAEEREAPRKRKGMPERYEEAAERKGGSGRSIDMKKLKRLSRTGRATAWSVKRLVSYVRSSGLSTISRTVDDFANGESEINSEVEARSCAKRIFKHVAKSDAK